MQQQVPDVLCLLMFEGDFQISILVNVFILLMLLKFPSALWIYGKKNFIFPLVYLGVPKVAGQSLEHICIYFMDQKV